MFNQNVVYVSYTTADGNARVMSVTAQANKQATLAYAKKVARGCVKLSNDNNQIATVIVDGLPVVRYGRSKTGAVAIVTNYQIERRDDDWYVIKRNGSAFTDGNLYATRARATRQAKCYQHLEDVTGEIRTTRGEWWPGLSR